MRPKNTKRNYRQKKLQRKRQLSSARAARNHQQDEAEVDTCPVIELESSDSELLYDSDDTIIYDYGGDPLTTSEKKIAVMKREQQDTNHRML